MMFRRSAIGNEVGDHSTLAAVTLASNLLKQLSCVMAALIPSAPEVFSKLVHLRCLWHCRFALWN